MSASELRYEFSEQGVSDCLSALGTTAGAVATNLSAMGFEGALNEPCRCPVANYLRTVIVGAVAAGVSKDENYVLYAEVENGDGGSVMVPAIPRPVADFVLQFDNRLFPDLIEEGLHAR